MGEDDLEIAYDEGYEEGQGRTGFLGMDWVKRVNGNTLRKELARKKGIRDGRADLEEEIETSYGRHDLSDEIGLDSDMQSEISSDEGF